MDWQAEVGDEVSVESHRLRAGRRKGTIREVLGAPGHEYYRVLWENRQESVFHPGSDAVLTPRGPRKARPTPPKPAAAPKRAKAAAPRPKPKPRVVAATGS